MNTNIILVIASCITSFFSSFMSSSINVAIPAIADSYNIAPQIIPNAISAYVITVTAFIFPSIALANRFGFRNIWSCKLSNYCHSCTFRPKLHTFYFRQGSAGHM